MARSTVLLFCLALLAAFAPTSALAQENTEDTTATWTEEVISESSDDMTDESFDSAIEAMLEASSSDMQEMDPLEVSSAPRLVSLEDGSVTLEWDAVENAAGYIVKYGTTSVANSEDEFAQYENETDETPETSTTISGLDPEMTYYFSLVAVDEAKNESDMFSDELAVNLATIDSETLLESGESLSVVSAWAINDRVIRIEFNSELSEESLDIRIIKTSDNATLALDSTTKDPVMPNTALVTLASELDPLTSYSITVISATDTEGRLIEEGIKGFQEFTTAAILPPYEEIALDAAGPEQPTEDDTADEVMETSLSAEAEAGDADEGSELPAELPDAGAETTLFVLLALAIAGTLFFLVRRNTTKG